jgi:hypothetical protein
MNGRPQSITIVMILMADRCGDRGKLCKGVHTITNAIMIMEEIYKHHEEM